MAIRTLSEKIAPASLKLAAEFSEMKPCTGECAFDPVHMENLATLWETGPYHAPIWASVYCKEDGQNYRGDGKHSSAVFHSKRLPVSGREVHLIRAECDYKSETGDFYNQFNQPESSRTDREINQSIAAQIAEIAGFSKPFIDRCVSGIDMSVRGTVHYDKTHKVSKLEKAKRLRVEKPFVLFLHAIHDTPGLMADIKHIVTVPVVAACRNMYLDNSALAREYITLFRDGSNPNHADPDRSLYEYLRSARLGASKKRDKNTVTESDILGRCMQGWEDYKAYKSGATFSTGRKPNHKKRGRRRMAEAV
jgi:hypothetical protein